MQRHEMIEAMRALGLKGMAGALDEAVTTGVQVWQGRFTPWVLLTLYQGAVRLTQ